MRAMVLSCAIALPVAAHESLPASLTLDERLPGTFDVQLRVPAREGPAPPLDAVAVGCQSTTARRLVPEVGAAVWRWSMQCAEHRDLRIDLHGLTEARIDVLVRASFVDGRTRTHIVRPDEPTVRFDVAPSPVQFVRLGIAHILGGIDHLLFVLGLLLLVRGLRPLLLTITAFTVSHSVTLALATLGVVRVPVAPVEASIALSIVFLARELLRPHDAEVSVAERKPWLVAFSFGLLHGFGFAGAMSTAGVPAAEVPAALVLFNVGVELGQVAFVAAVLAAVRLSRFARVPAPAWAKPALAYGIGITATYWFLERALAIAA